MKKELKERIKMIELEKAKIASEIIELAKENFTEDEIKFLEEGVFNTCAIGSIVNQVCDGTLPTEEHILGVLKNICYSTSPEKRYRIVNVLSPEMLKLMDKTFTEEEIKFMKDDNFSDKDVIKVIKYLDLDYYKREKFTVLEIIMEYSMDRDMEMEMAEDYYSWLYSSIG